MHDKYTTVLTRVPADVPVVPPDAFGVAFNEQTNRIQEYGAGRALPAASPLLSVYTVPAGHIETLFAVPGAFSCIKPDGSAFKPGLCLKLELSYISAAGLQKLLLALKRRDGRTPDCVTLEQLHALLIPDITAICEKAAGQLSNGQTLSYTQWWHEVSYDAAYRDLLYRPLMQLFMAHGLRLEKSSFALAGLAPVPIV